MDEKLREYARLLARVGLNLQKGQRLVISSPVECAAFARLCAQEAYDAGCGEGRHLEKEGLPGKLEFYISFGSRDDAFEPQELWAARSDKAPDFLFPHGLR